MTQETPTAHFASFAYGEGPRLDDPAELYQEAAKLRPSFAARQVEGLALATQPAVAASMRRASRRRPHLPRLALEVARTREEPLGAVLAARRSRLPAAGSTLDLADLATLSAPHELDPATGRRAVPSAGALYPLELYVLALRVRGLAPGAYHVDPVDRSLARLGPPPDLVGVFVDPAVTQQAAALVVVTGLFRRSRCKYGLRGYRFALLEAGHLMQALVLVATAAGIDSLPLGGFYDDGLERALRVDGVDESVLYAVAVGRSPG